MPSTVKKYFNKQAKEKYKETAKPSQAKPSQAKPSQAKPSQAKHRSPNQAFVNYFLVRFEKCDMVFCYNIIYVLVYQKIVFLPLSLQFCDKLARNFQHSVDIWPL
jgi:hypothetical protein